MAMNKWEHWFAWFPVKSVHIYGNCGHPYCWLCIVSRRKVDGKWEYTHWTRLEVMSADSNES